MTDQTTILTREGYHKLAAELKEIQVNRRPPAVDRLKKAREMGDLSENSEYVAAREDLNAIDNKIAELEEIIRTATIKDKSVDLSVVEVGDNVVLECDGKREMYMIVGEHESDITNGKLSHKSPLGSALMGKRKGVVIQVKTPGGANSYSIIDIN